MNAFRSQYYYPKFDAAKRRCKQETTEVYFSKINWWQDETMNLLLAICRKVNFEHIWLREKQSVIVTYRQNLFSPAILTSLTIKTSEDWHQDMVNHWVFLTDDHSRTRTRQPATYIFHANNKFTTSAKQNHQDTRLFTSYWVQIKSLPTEHLMQRFDLDSVACE